MKSFGIWYSNKNTQNTDSETEREPFDIDLHINLWDIGGQRKTDPKPFIDIGLNISGFRAIDTLCFQIPFSLAKEDVIDLSDAFSDNTTANLIFNDDCAFHRNGSEIASLELSENPGKPKLLYLLSESTWEVQESGDTIIKFDFKVIREDCAYKNFEDLYVRFRIQSDQIQEELFCKIKSKNWFLESGFNKTQVIDIKVNKKRNMNEQDIKHMRRNKFSFAEFGKIHFLVMEPADNKVEILGEDFIECRKLEDSWKGYLRRDADIGDVLAYHWKAKHRGEALKEYAKMVKVTSATTTGKIIWVYILVVIVIGVVTNMIFSYGVVPLIELCRELMA